MKTIMVGLLLVCLVVPLSYAQSPAPKYQVAHVIAAKVHQPSPNDRTVRYEVTLRVGNTDYIVLYTPPDGTDVVEYRLGRDGLVLIGAETIKFSDLLGRPHEVPILRRNPAQPKG